MINFKTSLGQKMKSKMGRSDSVKVNKSATTNAESTNKKDQISNKSRT